MGVTGLWKLIEPCGTPVPIETLEGKVLAVDISIWLHQVVKGFQDSNGSALAHAHLLGLFHRLCKLMYYRVKPVFVFDGCVPQLKRDTIAKRQQQRSKLNTEADRIQNLLLEQLAKEQVVQKALGNAASALVPSKRLLAKPNGREDDEMFKLPELPTSSHNSSFASSQDESSVMETSLDSSDDEENCARRYYTNNLQAIDVNAKDFRSLPADMRYDILVDIKETRKQSSWGRLHELPAQSDQFSSFQMKRLLKRRAVQESLEEAEKEMGGRSLTYAELQTYFKEEGVLEETAFEEASRRIACDENTRFLLVQDLKKQLAEKKEVEKLETVQEVKEEEKPIIVEESKVETENMSEYEADLQLAIALSISEKEQMDLYKEEDYMLKENKLKLNKTQREVLKNAAKGPAKSYMIEYAGMNQDEVEEILESSQACLPMAVEHTKVSESESDEDFVEVAEEQVVEVVIDLDKSMAADDDLFKDVFNEATKKHDTSMDTDSDVDLVEVATELENSQKTQTPEKQEEVVDNKESELNKEEIAVKKKNDKNKEIVEIEQFKLNTMDIYEEMRKQMENVSKIDLNQVEIKYNIIDVDAEQELDVQIKQEKIEIKTPSGTPKKSNSKPVTPSRITDYFDTEYIMKRTPQSLEKEQIEDVAKVKSPFFRRKTPKSKTPKRSQEEPRAIDIDMKTPSKAVRELFPETKKFTAEDVLQEVAAGLQQQKTRQELRDLATNLAKERREMESERNRQERMGMSISQRMNAECQELLRLFGVPYIVAPMEAEAQCAFLDAVQLTNGTITDDSDIWLFGGRTVYKNFFVQNKHVLKFSADEIESQFKCDRQTLVQLACLVGSDYTTGVHGIGAVTALEILSSFTRDSYKSVENMRQRIKLIMDTLQRFRDWWQNSKLSAAPPGSSARQTLLKKLKNIELQEGFPSMAVIEAYLLPKVDESRTAFSWGQPDVESIREFARKTFGWTTTKTDEILRPVLKRLAEKRTQTTMRNYFLTSKAAKSRELKVSKRVQGAIERLALGGEDAQQESAATETVPAKKPKKINVKRLQSKADKSKGNAAADMEPSTSAAAVQRGARKSNRKTAVIGKKEIIPQREKDLERMRKNKELAAVLFQASAAVNKKKKK